MQKLGNGSFTSFKQLSKCQFGEPVRTASFIYYGVHKRYLSTPGTQNWQHKHRRNQQQQHRQQHNQHREQNGTKTGRRYIGGAALAGSSVVALTLDYARKNFLSTVLAKEEADASVTTAHVGRIRADLPEFGSEEIRRHDSLENRVWVTYKDGVYDITDFIGAGNHPGGNKIYMAAGGGVEPFWHLYAVHLANPEVLLMLEEYRIGNLAPEERSEKAKEEAERKANDPYANDPKRHRLLRPASAKPFNAEPPPSILSDAFVTPNDVFYVRNHLPVPDVDPDAYELEIQIEGKDEPAVLTLEDIKTKFAKVSVTSAIQCAGNRRSEMNAVKALKGLPWGRAAIGNATWSGAKLKDVLAWAGVTEDNVGSLRHLHLNGLDEGADGSVYAVSVPLSKALSSLGDCILAYEMNGETLPRDHGYPIRAIVPGSVGARNVKWLGQMVVSTEESDGHWQANDYKGFSPSVDWNNVDFTSSPAIQELPVQSAICDPEDGDVVKLTDDGRLPLRGYAWSGGGRGVVRVDVSVDGGQNWQVADLIRDETQEYNRQWAWTLWRIDAEVSPELARAGDLQICIKASDSAYNTQPEEFAPIWNLRGVLSNAWHKIRVHLEETKKCDDDDTGPA